MVSEGLRSFSKCSGVEIVERAFACAFFDFSEMKMSGKAKPVRVSSGFSRIPSHHHSTWPPLSHSTTSLLTSSRHRLLCSDGISSTSQSSQKQAILLNSNHWAFFPGMPSAFLHVSHCLSTTRHSPSHYYAIASHECTVASPRNIQLKTITSAPPPPN